MHHEIHCQYKYGKVLLFIYFYNLFHLTLFWGFFALKINAFIIDICLVN